ncbi:MAG: FeoB-associated Cys-rich membrane protein [Planctomycetaceae bacterium]|nr:FeoB-associated Cys-rich membrane protein [Planctomycetaceae bacterium]
MTWFGMIVGGIALAAVVFFMRKEAKSGSCGSCGCRCGSHNDHSCHSRPDSAANPDDESGEK